MEEIITIPVCLHQGDIAYYVENDKYIREIRLIEKKDDLWTIEYIEGGLSILKENMIFSFEKQAQKYIDSLNK